MPKTAGTTADAVLSGAAAARARKPQLIPRAIGMRERSVPAGMFSDERTLFHAGRCWFGFHRMVGRPGQICTALRDPVARAISEYLRRSSSRGRPESVDDFQHHLDNVALSNIEARLLAEPAG